MDEVEVLRARLSSLEDALATCKAQAEASAINSDAQIQTLELKYQELLERHEGLSHEATAQRSSLDSLTKELRESKEDNTQLKLQLSQRETQLQQRTSQAELLQQEKQQLQDFLEQRRLELQSKSEEIASLLEKNVVIIKERALYESRAHDALALQNKLETECTSLKQRVADLEQTNSLLEGSLSQSKRKFLEDQHDGADKLLRCQLDLQQVRGQLVASQRHGEELQERLETCQQNLDRTSAAYHELEENHHQMEENLRQQVAGLEARSTRYQQLYDSTRETLEKLKPRVLELETHLNEVTAANKKALQLEMDARTEAENLVDQLRLKLEQVTAAAGSLPLEGTGPGPSTPAAAGPASTPVTMTAVRMGSALPLTPLSPASLVLPDGKTVLEVYNMYTEAEDNFRRERARTRKLEAYIDQICVELESRARSIQEREERCDRVLEAHHQLQLTTEDVKQENHVLEARVKGLQAQLSSMEENVKTLEERAKDDARKIAVLLAEVDRMQGRPVAEPVEAAPGALVQANDVITQHLVTFKNYEELVLKNSQLISVARTLAADLEKDREELRQKYRTELEAEQAVLAQEVESLRTTSQQLAKQIATYRANAVGGRIPASEGSQGPIDSQVMEKLAATERQLAAATADLERSKEESAMQASMVNAQLQELGTRVKQAEGERGRMQANLEFEQQQVERLKSSVTSLKRQLEGVNQELAVLRTKNTLLESQSERMRQERDLASNDCRELTQKVGKLEGRIHNFMENEKHLQQELQVAQERSTSLYAEVLSAQNLATTNMEILMKDLKRLQEREQQLQKQVHDLNDELLKEKDRRGDTVVAAVVRAQDFTEENSRLKRTLAEVDAKNKEMQVRLQTLEEQLESSRGRVTTLERQLADRDKQTQSGAQDETAVVRIHELEGEVKVLQAELDGVRDHLTSSRNQEQIYKALAATHQETLMQLQAELEDLRERYKTLEETSDQEMVSLRSRLGAAEELRDQLAEDLRQARQDREQLRSELATAREECEVAVSSRLRELEDSSARIARLQEEVERLDKEARTTQSLYEKELLAHADAVRRFNASEVTLQNVQEELAASRSQSAMSKSQFEEMLSQLQSEMEELKGIKAEQEVQLREVQHRNEVLLGEVENLAKRVHESGTVEAGDSSMGEVVMMIRRDRAELQGRLVSKQVECERLLREKKIRERDLAEARAEVAQLRSERQSVIMPAEHVTRLQELMESVQSYKESNQFLREQNRLLTEQAREASERAEKMHSEHDPLVQKISELEASIATQQLALESSERLEAKWRERAEQLVHKYQAIDIEEYHRVQEELRVRTARLEELEKEATSTAEECQQLREELEKVNNQLVETSKELEAEKKENQERYKTTTQALERLKEEREENVRLQNVLEEAKEQKSKTEKDLAELKEKVKRRIQALSKQLEEKKQQVEQEVSKSQGLEGSYSELQKQLEEKQQELDTTTTQMKAAQARSKDLVDKYNSLVHKTKVTKANSNKELEEANAKAEKWEAEAGKWKDKAEKQIAEVLRLQDKGAQGGGKGGPEEQSAPGPRKRIMSRSASPSSTATLEGVAGGPTPSKKRVLVASDTPAEASAPGSNVLASSNAEECPSTLVNKTHEQEVQETDKPGALTVPPRAGPPSTSEGGAQPQPTHPSVVGPPITTEGGAQLPPSAPPVAAPPTNSESRAQPPVTPPPQAAPSSTPEGRAQPPGAKEGKKTLAILANIRKRTADQALGPPPSPPIPEPLQEGEETGGPDPEGQNAMQSLEGSEARTPIEPPTKRSRVDDEAPAAPGEVLPQGDEGPGVEIGGQAPDGGDAPPSEGTGVMEAAARAPGGGGADEVKGDAPVGEAPELHVGDIDVGQDRPDDGGPDVDEFMADEIEEEEEEEDVPNEEEEGEEDTDGYGLAGGGEPAKEEGLDDDGGDGEQGVGPNEEVDLTLTTDDEDDMRDQGQTPEVAEDSLAGEGEEYLEREEEQIDSRRVEEQEAREDEQALPQSPEGGDPLAMLDDEVAMVDNDEGEGPGGEDMGPPGGADAPRTLSSGGAVPIDLVRSRDTADSDLPGTEGDLEQGELEDSLMNEEEEVEDDVVETMGEEGDNGGQDGGGMEDGELTQDEDTGTQRGDGATGADEDKKRERRKTHTRISFNLAPKPTVLPSTAAPGLPLPTPPVSTVTRVPGQEAVVASRTPGRPVMARPTSGTPLIMGGVVSPGTPGMPMGAGVGPMGRGTPGRLAGRTLRGARLGARGRTGQRGRGVGGPQGPGGMQQPPRF